jgi:hypothetical protein
MEIVIARTYKRELEKKIAELLKEYENNTSLTANGVRFIRQAIYDNLGNEIDYNYAVEVETRL